MTHSFPFKPSTLAACIFTTLNLSFIPPQSLAAEVEPAIQAGPGYSLGLRNDGILFQFGGTFTPVPFPGTLTPPLRPDSQAILTDVVSLVSTNNTSSSVPQEIYQGSGGAMALVTIGSKSDNLFTWNTMDSSSIPTLTIPGFKELKTNDQGNTVLFTHTGEVFTLWQGSTIVALPGLSHVKEVVMEWDNYVALTTSGTVLVGRWDWSTQQFTPALPISGISGAIEIGRNYALTSSGELHMWEWYWDNTLSAYLPSQNTLISGVSNIKKLFLKQAPFVVLTNDGKIYQWAWNWPTHTATPATLVNGISGGITDVIQVSQFNVALTDAGEVYAWQWDFSTQTPLPASLVLNDIISIIEDRFKLLALEKTGQVYMGWAMGKVPFQVAVVNGVSNAKTLRANGWDHYFALTAQGEVYMWGWEAPYYGPTTATQISDISGIKMISLSSAGLTDQGEVYIFKWDDATHTPIVSQVSGLPSDLKEFQFQDWGGYYIALTKQGAVYMWPYSAPIATQVVSGGISSFAQIKTQRSYENNSWSFQFLALTDDKKLYVWEWKNNTTQAAIQVGAWSDVIAFSVGQRGSESHVLVLREQGQLCGWGNNSLGQLGSTAPNSVPITNPWCGGSDNLGIEDLIVVETTESIYPLNITKVGQGQVKASLGKILCGETCSDSYLANSVVKLTATPDLGYLFKEWNGGCQGTQVQTEVTLSGITECTATFDPAPLRTLTINKSGDGQGTVTVKDPSGTTIDCGNHCTEQFLNNSPLTLEVRAHEDSKFMGWSGEGCAHTFTMTEDKICTALFTRLSPKTLSITKEGHGQVISAPSGIDCGTTCSAPFAERSTIKLTAIPEAGSQFVRWGGDCGGSQDKTLSVMMNTDFSCTAYFHLPVPNIVAFPSPVKFNNVVLGGSRSQPITIRNDGEVHLEIGSATLTGDNVFKLNNTNCTNRKLTPYESAYETRYCLLYVTFYPDSTEPKTATLSIPSNDPDTPIVTIPVQGVGGCQGQVQGPWVSRSKFEFGVQKVGQPRSLALWIYSSTDCGLAPKVDETELTGSQEFSVSQHDCYHGMWDDRTYVTCQMTLSFSPHSAGKKEGELHLTFTDPSVHFAPIPLHAEAKNSDPQIEVSPSQVDFGHLPIGELASQNVAIKNSGEVNLNLKNVSLTGDPSFRLPWWANCEYYFGYYGAPWMLPGDQCQMTPLFMPLQSIGEKSGTITVHSDASNTPTLPVPLTGTAEPLCLEKNVTIESIHSGAWKEGTTWNGGSPPTAQDVVKIKTGHTITALPYATVKGLCIESGATLESRDELGTPLEIYAAQYIENKGMILGKPGAAETDETNKCIFPWKVGLLGCAQNGTSVFLKSGLSGGRSLFHNEGTILAGAGGNGKRYAGKGGSVYISGGGVINLPNEQGEGGIIRSGKGGNLIGTQVGLAGQGGETNVSASSSWVINQGISTSGEGGDCNPIATEPQAGGNGGIQRWRGPSVNLQGSLLMGKGGNQCLPLGVNGIDGDLLVEPNVISLSGASTKIEGGNITIFGGNEWILNLRHLNAPIIKATGDITLAVGARGAIDLSGNTQVILEAIGQVNIFSDNILLDEGIKLTDLIKAKNIVVGRAKILRDVSLVASDHVTGQPGTTLPIVVTVNNSGPEEDHYLLKTSSQAGWPVNIVEASDLAIEGLSSKDVTLHVTIPPNLSVDDLEVITVTVTSQADQDVSDTFEVRVAAAIETPDHPSVEKPSPPPAAPLTTPEEPVTPIGEEAVISTPEVSIPNGEEETSTTEKTEVIISPSVSVPLPPTPNTNFILAPVTQTLQGCPPTGKIDFMCDNRDHVISNAIFEPQATVAGGELAGTLTSEGFISQVTIQPHTELKGGTLSGFIINQGTLIDFQFVGAQIKGGTLAGEITNLSKVGGTLIDVMLAPHTHLKGGKLKGKIQGDPHAPALLEEVRVLSGSHLSGVKLGKGVVLEEGVIVEKEKQEEPPEFLLPSLGEASGIDEQGHITTTTAKFTGGIALQGGKNFSIKQEIKALTEQVEVIGHIIPDPTHVGQEVELVVYATYHPSLEEEAISFLLNGEGKVLPWDEKLSSLKPFQEKVVFQTDAGVDVKIYQGTLLSPGIVRLHFGYRLPEGLLISHHEVIELMIFPPSSM